MHQIMVTQNPLGPSCAPAQLRLMKVVIEVPAIESRIEAVKIERPAQRAAEHFSTALLPGQIRRAKNLGLICVLAIERLIFRHRPFVEELRNKDEGERFMDLGRSVTQNV